MKKLLLSETGGSLGYHGGIDIASQINLDVKSITDGKVDSINDYFGLVSIKDNQGLYHVYMHLDRIDVAVDQVIYQGDYIGLTGTKGTVAPHLHYEVSKKSKGALTGLDLSGNDPRLHDKQHFRDVSYNPLQVYWENNQVGRYFYDVPDTNIFSPYINLLADWQVINGYEDGSYQPERSVTRGEMAKFIVNAFDLPSSKTSPNGFLDVDENDTFTSYIDILQSLEIVVGETYRPEEEATREEFANFTYGAGLWLSNNVSNGTFQPDGSCAQDFSDLSPDISDESFFAISTLKCYDIVNGYEDGTFRPGNLVTRGEMAKFMVNGHLAAKGITPLSLDSSGWIQGNPKLGYSDEDWQVFENATSGLWFDPPTTYGFEFESLEDTLFTSILDFPTGIDSDNLFSVWVGDTKLGNFSPGQRVDFGAGVSSFTIADINGLLDPNSPTAFPIQLAFNEKVGDFRMRAFDKAESVPEPGSVSGLIALGTFGAGSIMKRKRIQQEKK